VGLDTGPRVKEGSQVTRGMEKDKTNKLGGGNGHQRGSTDVRASHQQLKKIAYITRGV